MVFAVKNYALTLFSSLSKSFCSFTNTQREGITGKSCKRVAILTADIIFSGKILVVEKLEPQIIEGLSLRRNFQRPVAESLNILIDISLGKGAEKCEQGKKQEHVYL